MSRVLVALSLLFVALAALVGAPREAAAAPAQVAVGAYVNKVQDVSFRDNRYVLDLYVWFRWKAEGVLAEYKPLDSFELQNGKIESKSSVVEKKVGDTSYASVRVLATVSASWDLRAFPFDRHTLHVDLEDSVHTAQDLVFVPDVVNSRLGDEIDLTGWRLDGFRAEVRTKTYATSYGDPSLPADARSDYSRLRCSWNMSRETYGTAWKLLTTVLAATGVAFLAFLVKPSDLDPRFGLGVGALFAVAASAFVVSSSVPDSGVMTAADELHILSLAFIFASLLQSAFALKLEAKGETERSRRFDRFALVAFPALFAVLAWRVIGAAIHG